MSDHSKPHAEAIRVLREAKYLLINNGWVQGYFAYNVPVEELPDAIPDDELYIDQSPWEERITRGLTARTLEDGKCFCMIGALGKAMGRKDFTSGFNTPAEYYLVDAISKRENGVSTHVPSWNDAPGRTKEQVLAVFDEAIDIAVSEQKLAEIRSAYRENEADAA